MTFTKTRDLVAIAVITGIVIYLALRAFYGDLPPLPIFAALMLGLLAIVELLLGFPLRARVRSGSRVVQPLTYARAVALAKASSILGALMFGAWLAAVVYLLPERGRLAAAADDVPAALAGVVCSAALAGAALWLEYCCRTPQDPDDHDSREIDQKL
jgi:uncharacterized protein DUF3180